MLRLIAHLAANALVVLILQEVLPAEVSYDNNETLAIFALVLGLLNAVVRPILHIIALPLTCLTLGLFALVVSAAVFYLAGVLVPGITVTVLGAAIGALLLGVITGIIDSAMR
jgi:putative membrane protein